MTLQRSLLYFMFENNNKKQYPSDGIDSPGARGVFCLHAYLNERKSVLSLKY